MRGGTSVYIVRAQKQSVLLSEHICIPESQKRVDADVHRRGRHGRGCAELLSRSPPTIRRSSRPRKALSQPEHRLLPQLPDRAQGDGVGFEIYLLAEYRQTLAEVLAGPMTQSGAVNLGVDLCSALCSLREGDSSTATSSRRTFT